MHAIWLLSLTGLVACFTVDFGQGAGAGGEQTGGSPAQGAGPNGAGGQGGEGAADGGASGDGGSGGCLAACNDDHRCGDDGCGGLCSNTALPDTWGLRTPTPTYAVLPWPETQSVFVGSHASQVRRVDACTGEVMASFSLPDGDGEREIKQLSLFGDTLIVSYNEPEASGSAKQVLKLAARTLLAQGRPMLLGGELESRPFFGGDSGPSHAWLNLTVEGFVARIDALGSGCTRAIDFNVTEPGGVVALGDTDAIVAWSGPTNGRLYRVSPSSAECAAVAVQGSVFDTGQRPYGLAHNSTQVYAAMFGEIDNDPGCPLNLEAGILRADLATLTQQARSEFEPNHCIDAFVDVVADDDAVFAVGAHEADDIALGGAAWVARFDPAFESNDAPIAQTFPAGALIVWKAAIDRHGLYLTGDAGNDAGFLIKCTRELQCGSVPD